MTGNDSAGLTTDPPPVVTDPLESTGSGSPISSDNPVSNTSSNPVTPNNTGTMPGDVPPMLIYDPGDLGTVGPTQFLNVAPVAAPLSLTELEVSGLETPVPVQIHNPEPASMLLAVLGGACAAGGGWTRRRRQQVKLA